MIKPFIASSRFWQQSEGYPPMTSARLLDFLAALGPNARATAKLRNGSMSIRVKIGTFGNNTSGDVLVNGKRSWRPGEPIKDLRIQCRNWLLRPESTADMMSKHLEQRVDSPVRTMT